MLLDAYTTLALRNPCATLAQPLSSYANPHAMCDNPRPTFAQHLHNPCLALSTLCSLLATLLQSLCWHPGTLIDASHNPCRLVAQLPHNPPQPSRTLALSPRYTLYTASVTLAFPCNPRTAMAQPSSYLPTTLQQPLYIPRAQPSGKRSLSGKQGKNCLIW